MKTIIAGSRGLTDPQHLIEALEAAEMFAGIKPTHVISGACANSPDALGEAWAKEKGLSLELCPADWAHLGQLAGRQRNHRMALRADALIAIWDGHSSGTKHMIGIAERLKLAVYVHRVSGSKKPDLSLAPQDKTPKRLATPENPLPKLSGNVIPKASVDLFAESAGL
jgi:YspA, cpYpsA-related SLOG family